MRRARATDNNASAGRAFHLRYSPDQVILRGDGCSMIPTFNLSAFAKPDACRRKRAMKRERNLRLLIVDGRGDDLELCVRSRLRAKLNERPTDESNMERRDASRK